ncbi:hypothetical protein [Brevundimonas sp.]|jgi:hypothetical protein|uniref:hypothetical protein n=1 Tax=Brevundimonas sp. TaxID=1871086 RepID=UPI0035B3FE2D
MIVLALMLALAGQTTSLPTPVEDRTPSTTAVRLSATAPAPTAAEERQAGRRLVCRNENVTGSRFPVRRCRPAELTPQEQALAADQLRRQQTIAWSPE